MEAEIELAWAAGFFDGEGNTCIKDRYSNHPTIQVSVSQKYDRFVLDRFRAAVLEIGRIYWPPPDHERKYGHYDVSGPSALQVLSMLWPYLSPVKKEQAKRKIKEANHYMLNQLLKTKVVILGYETFETIYSE